jgi:hypothetical protein
MLEITAMRSPEQWTDWHLTSHGWEQGSRQLEFGDCVARRAPRNRVLTCRYYEHHISAHSPPNEWTAEEWRSKKEPRIQQLLREFGPCPKHL